jgi:hypothetical protein
MNLEDCLPPHLRGASTTITKIGAGLSGAGVYRVQAEGRAFALKISPADEPLDTWRQKLDIQQLASDAGLAPTIVHQDEARRAVVSAMIVDRSFPGFYADPRTREAAITLLGRTVRRVHDLPLPPTARSKDPREFLAGVWSGPLAGFALPGFVGDAVRRVLAEEPPAGGHAPVLSHNDVNPTNLAYDGERLMLLDWETAGPNDPLYDLAAISIFLRMDEAAQRMLVAAYDGAPVAHLRAGLAYYRRLVAVLCGAVFLDLARQSGHAGAAGDETAGSALSLGEFYQKMRTGSLTIAAPEGQWCFGLALVKDGLSS